MAAPSFPTPSFDVYIAYRRILNDHSVRIVTHTFFFFLFSFFFPPLTLAGSAF